MTKGYNKTGRGAGILILLLLLGGLAGSTLHDILLPYLPLGRAVAEVGFAPTTLDLRFIKVTLGLTVTISPLTIIGLLLGYLLYRKL